MHKIKGFLALLASAVIFGSFGIWIRILSQDFTAYQQIAIKNIGAFFFAIIFIFLFKQKVRFNQVKKLHIFLYIFSYLCSVMFFTLSILTTKVATTVFALYVGSLVSSLVVGTVIFKEKITGLKLLSLGIVLIGLYIFVAPLSLKTLNVGLGLGLLAGFADTLTNSTRKHLSGKIDRFVLAAMQMAAGAGLAFVLMFFAGQVAIPSVSVTSWVAGSLYGFFTISIAYLMLVGFQNFDLNLGTIVLSSELFFATVFALFLFHEVPQTQEVVGSILIILAIAVMHLQFKKVDTARKMAEVAS